jgi:hypothetical protein
MKKGIIAGLGFAVALVFGIASADAGTCSSSSISSYHANSDGWKGCGKTNYVWTKKSENKICKTTSAGAKSYVKGKMKDKAESKCQSVCGSTKHRRSFSRTAWDYTKEGGSTVYFNVYYKAQYECR